MLTFLCWYLYSFYILTSAGLPVHLVTNSSSSTIYENDYFSSAYPFLCDLHPYFIHLAILQQPFLLFQTIFQFCSFSKPSSLHTVYLSRKKTKALHQTFHLAPIHQFIKRTFFLSPIHPSNLPFDSNPYHRSKEPSFWVQSIRQIFNFTPIHTSIKRTFLSESSPSFKSFYLTPIHPLIIRTVEDRNQRAEAWVFINIFTRVQWLWCFFRKWWRFTGI